MTEPAQRRASYEDLLDAPDHVVADIIDGERSPMARLLPFAAPRRRPSARAMRAPRRARRFGASGLLLALAACQSAAEPAPPPAPESTVEEPPAPLAAEPLEAPVLITDESQREAAVGKRVTVVGVQTRTKMPQVNGVDVDGDYELSDRRVRVDGILRKRVVAPREPDPDELPVATRGPGTYYSVIDPETGRLARPRPE